MTKRTAASRAITSGVATLRAPGFFGSVKCSAYIHAIAGSNLAYGYSSRPE